MMAQSEKHKDRTVIQIEKQEDVDFWKNTFGVDEDALRSAVKKVGNNTKEVSAYLCQERIANEKSNKLEHG